MNNYVTLKGGIDLKKEKSIAYTFRFMSFICFLTVFALLLLLRVFGTETFLSWYGKYTSTLESFEIWIETYGATVLAVIIILMNYLLKSLIPWFPISCICVASAMVFKWYIALMINLVGISLLFALKYLWGKHHGGGNAEKILKHYDTAHKLVEESKHGSDAVLFVSRLLPSVPVNAISCVYGTTGMPLWRFILISDFGILYKIVTYIIIGRNVFDPASANFVVPFIPLLLLSGLIFFSLGGALDEIKKEQNQETY